ncbi:MAG: polyprenyl synthetase family protein [Oligoflexia bacterium]|nr:polyprenyl synthetase family protein [Oligoflexia bacterium]
MTEVRFDDLKKTVDQYILNYGQKLSLNVPERGATELVRSMQYSMESGGHRIRPMLSLLTAQALGKSFQDVLPFGCAVEFVHGYSLVHDDLPCMDDDDFRRGKPSNHKVFGEALAVLAGDALLSEAFLLVAEAYGDNPGLALALSKDLAQASSARGLVGGQATDLVLRNKTIDLTELEQLHLRKTGALFRTSVMGAATICGATSAQKESLEIYAANLGLTFQIADDISDKTDNDELSFVKAVGLDGARKRCEKLVAQAHEALALFGSNAEGLKSLVTYVYKRTEIQ